MKPIVAKTLQLARTAQMDLSKIEKICCPLCEHPAARPKHSIRSWNIVQCCACGFIYVNPRLEKSELLKIYTSNYFDNKEVGYYHYTENKELRRKNFKKWVEDALPFFTPTSHAQALDVGCAAGYCLDVFRELQWKAFGIELDKELAASLRKKEYSIFDSPLITLNTNEKFRFITLFDVIEHLTDLSANMTILHSLLEDDGIVVLVTPDYGSWQRKLFNRKWFQFKPIEHINYFTSVSLQQLAEKTGFTVIYTNRCGQFCDLSFLENRLKKYRFRFLLPFFHLATRLLRLQKKHFYVDTASLYVVLKKKKPV
ncbi:MAG TPA: class I SAM-dependent methyltransferase [Flavisolibacter sp.]|jgi:2-polyprenyl-3-methyl-5-hydroxy-6-metoxy-1,4-benzoquinol methylase